ncbi:MAG: C39 family peptidase [Lactimicrobium sp.]|jgi:hypothetical protein|uniref:C39 family peptidase n=1 Tax=Lactimicrobium sp. TaxID=2563780 RepID=UPI002F35C626
MEKGTYYLNQNEYPDVEYLTDVQAKSDPAFYEHGSIKEAGCGLCSAGMMLYDFFGIKVPLKDLLQLSYSCQANLSPGTDMKRFGEALCTEYGLAMSYSNSLSDVTSCLENGGLCIANVGGDRQGHVGTYSHGGHYIYVFDYDQKTREFLILDPSYYPHKYEEKGREGLVKKDGNVCRSLGQVLLDDTANRDPGFYLFTKKEAL